MMLYILRHGVAEDAPPGVDDGERRLTPRGREKLRGVAAGIRAMRLQLDLMLTSPMARAAETAEIVAAAYGNRPAPQIVAALAQGVAPIESISALKSFENHDHVMIVGHEPGLSAVAAILLAGAPRGLSLDLKKGGLVGLRLPDGFERAGAQLCWMFTSRQLRRIGK